MRPAKQHAYITNARNDFLHKLSKAIIDENQVVVVEDINVKGLLKSRLTKSIFDSAWSKFVSYLKYKAEWYGRTFIQVDRFFPSSKLCHRCGYKNEDLALHDRTWCCPACGESHDRDINASINLYLVGLGRHGGKQALVDDRSHPATKQEAQLQKVEQSAFFVVTKPYPQRFQLTIDRKNNGY